MGLLFALTTVSFAQEVTKPAASPSPKPRPAMSKTQIQKQLIATEKKLWEGWKNKDAKPFKSILAADSVMISEAGANNKESTVKFIGDNDCVVRSYELSDFKVTMFNSSTALLTYKATQDATCMGTAEPPTVWTSSLYLQRGVKWYAATHQQTTAAANP